MTLFIKEVHPWADEISDELISEFGNKSRFTTNQSADIHKLVLTRIKEHIFNIKLIDEQTGEVSDDDLNKALSDVIDLEEEDIVDDMNDPDAPNDESNFNQGGIISVATKLYVHLVRAVSQKTSNTSHPALYKKFTQPRTQSTDLMAITNALLSYAEPYAIQMWMYSMDLRYKETEDKDGNIKINKKAFQIKETRDGQDEWRDTDIKPPKNLFPNIVTLTNEQVARLIAEMHYVTVVTPKGQTQAGDYDLIALYCDDHESSKYGTYMSEESAFLQRMKQYRPSISTVDFREIMFDLRNRAHVVERSHNPDLIPVQNGIYNYKDDTLLPFSPEIIFLSKSQVPFVENPINPVITNPDGTTWDVDSWIDSLSDDPEVRHALWQILCASLRPNNRWNKAAWLISEKGNNGKGTFCELIRNLIGGNSAVSLPLASFSQDFMLEQLIHASAIVVDENDVGEFIERSANLKAVVTNDVIMINRKNKQPISYQFYGFMVQCLNDLPRVKDRSDSFYRRQLYIPMTKNFAGVERKYIKEDYLNRPEVLQYVLWKVLTQLPKFYTLDTPEVSTQMLDEHRKSNDPVREFWDSLRDIFVWDLLPYSFLYDLYKAWYMKNVSSGSVLSKNHFIHSVEMIVDTDPAWSINKQNVRSKGRMDRPEPLIVAYDLKDWKAPGTKPKDPDGAVPLLNEQYRGIVRIANNN